MTIAQTTIDKLIVALDVPTGNEALALARSLAGQVGMFKVGLELFCAEGPAFVREVQKAAPVFLDLKLHDIPNTVRKAMEALLPLDPSLVTIHTQGDTPLLTAMRASETAGSTGFIAAH